MSLFQDNVIQLIRRVDQNWAEGRLSGVIGIFPLNYVKVTETAKLLLDMPMQQQQRLAWLILCFFCRFAVINLRTKFYMYTTLHYRHCIGANYIPILNYCLCDWEYKFVWTVYCLYCIFVS